MTAVVVFAAVAFDFDGPACDPFVSKTPIKSSKYTWQISFGPVAKKERHVYQIHIRETYISDTWRRDIYIRDIYIYTDIYIRYLGERQCFGMDCPALMRSGGRPHPRRPHPRRLSPPRCPRVDQRAGP